MLALVETIGRLVSLEFLKHCTMSEVKILFYSIWNLAFEAKEQELYKECQLMLKTLYETVKKFSQFFSDNQHQATGMATLTRITTKAQPSLFGNKQGGKDESVI